MKVREFLTDESKWTQGAYARNTNRLGVPPSHPSATCWCLMGAVVLCYEGKKCDKVVALIASKLFPEKPHWLAGIPNWNDDPTRTFQDVKNLVNELDI